MNNFKNLIPDQLKLNDKPSPTPSILIFATTIIVIIIVTILKSLF